MKEKSRSIFCCDSGANLIFFEKCFAFFIFLRVFCFSSVNLTSFSAFFLLLFRRSFFFFDFLTFFTCITSFYSIASSERRTVASSLIILRLYLLQINHSHLQMVFISISMFTTRSMARRIKTQKPMLN